MIAVSGFCWEKDRIITSKNGIEITLPSLNKIRCQYRGKWGMLFHIEFVVKPVCSQFRERPFFSRS